MITRDKKIELRLIGVGVAVAVVGTCLAAAFSFLSKQTADETLRETRSSAWDYSGAQNCHAYRTQVMELSGRSVPAEGIRAWFAGEAGGKENPYGAKSDNETALEDLEEGCGTVADLVAIVESGHAP